MYGRQFISPSQIAPVGFGGPKASSAPGLGLNERAASLRGFCRCHVIYALVGAAVWLNSLSGAYAQQDWTIQNLIEDSVSEIGAQYGEIDQAITRFKNNDREGALALLTNVVGAHPELPPAVILMGRMHRLSNQRQAEMSLLEQAARNFPEDPEAYVRFAEDAIVNRRITESEIVYGKAAGLIEAYDGNPKRKRSLRLRLFSGLGTIAEQRKDWAEAIEHFRAYLDENPDQDAVHQRLGAALFRSGQPQDGYAELKESHSLNPDRWSHPDIAMGLLYQEQQNAEEAKKHYERAISDDPDSLGTRLAVVRWLARQEDYGGAKEHLDHALTIDGTSLDALLLSGMISRLNGDDASAEDFFENAHLLYPRDFNAINQLAMVLLDQENDSGKQARALQYAQLNALLAQQQQRNTTDATVTLAWIYQRRGQTSAAEQLLQQVTGARNQNTRPDSVYFLARMFAERNNKEAAIRFLDSALGTKGLFLYREQAQALRATLGP